MSPFDVWLLLSVVGIIIGFVASIKSTCLNMVVGTNKSICFRRYSWVEWGDVAPKSAVAMIMLGVADVMYWGIRELLAERGARITPLEARLEYAMVWGGILAIATGMTVLAVYLLTRPLRN
jgi:hypothetical protein